MLVFAGFDGVVRDLSELLRRSGDVDCFHRCQDREELHGSCGVQSVMGGLHVQEVGQPSEPLQLSVASPGGGQLVPWTCAGAGCC